MPTIDNDSADLMTFAGQVQEFYDGIGFDENDFIEADPSQVATLEEIITLAIDELTASPSAGASSYSSTSDENTGKLAQYSQSKAALNNTRDANATTLEKETVYMFLSHYVDTPGCTSFCLSYAETNLYADWITNSDRTAYNSFLTAVNLGGLANNLAQGAIAAADLAPTSLSAIAKDLMSGNAGLVLKGLIQAAVPADAATQVASAADQILNRIDQNDSAEAIIDDLISDMTVGWGDRDTASAVIGVTAFMLLPTVAGAIGAIGSPIVSMAVYSYAGLYQRAAIVALHYGTSGRVPGRMFRSWGM